MQWCEAVVHTTTIGSDLVSEELMALGAAGTEIVDRADVPDPRKAGVYWELYDPKMVEAMPEDVLVKGWFELNERTADVMGLVRARLSELKAEACVDMGTLALELQNVADEDWSENWKKYYKPFRIGSHLVVKPTWEPYEAQEGDQIIELDPGMAFGTGTHETTAMCVAMIEKHYHGGEVLDVGTGSGILAIAAARLGAREVLGVDIDPMAVRVAQENVEKNGLADRVTICEGDLVKGLDNVQCEFAVANILAEVIMLLAAPLKSHLTENATFVCSGILREREDEVTKVLTANGYQLFDRMEKGDWVALAARVR